MRTLRLALSTLILLSGLVFAPAPQVALAVDPAPTGPVTIHSYGFENTGIPGTSDLWKTYTPSYDSHWTIAKDPLPYFGTTAKYIWGPEPNSKRTGSYGLWCAAYDTTYPGYSYNWALYQKDTAGRARLRLPELEDYYSSTLQFYWKMPSRGAGDTNSFGVLWGPLGTPIDTGYGGSWDSWSYFPVSSTWQRKTFDLSALSLSREQGDVLFRFINFVEGGSQSPSAGQGPTIDDVSVTGYKYGPVRNLEATATAGGIELSWDKPHDRIGSTDTEDRAITYRIWRRPAASTTWTEVTATRIDDQSESVAYTDTTAATASDYVYRVVTYDSGTGTKYGELTDIAASIPDVSVDVSGDASPDTVRAGSDTTFTYLVQNTGGVTLTGITVEDSFGTITTGVPSSLSAGQSFELSREVAPGSTMTNTVSVDAEGLSIAVGDTADIDVTVVDPAISLDTSVSPDEIPLGDDVTFSYTVTNGGDVLLENIAVSDVYGQLTTGVPSTLAVGASFTATRDVSPSATTANGVTVSATGSGFGVSAEDTATATVRNPSVSIEASVTPTSIIEGFSATFGYQITNTGDVEIGSIAVTDAFGAVTTGVPSTLASGASFTVDNVVSPVASVLNTVTVTAAALGKSLSSSAVQFLQVRDANPDIGVTATVVPGTIAAGSSATFSYEITNIGNVTLEDLAVADDYGAVTSGVPASLDPDESVTVTRDASPAASFTNDVTVTGTASGTGVEASDSAYLVVTHPAVTVVGSVNPATIAQGSSATFTYTITNSGDVTLTGLTAADDYGAFSSGIPSSLAVGSSYQLQRTVSPAGSVSNTIDVAGIGTGVTVNDSDDVGLTVVNPAVSISASVTPSAIAAGSSATFTYRITNTGDTTLSSFTLTDTFGAVMTGVPSSLAPAAWVDVVRVASPLNGVSNTVTVQCGAYGKTVSDTDVVGLTVTHPSLTLSATVSDAISKKGTPLDFTYTVNNGGDVTVDSIEITDAFGSLTSGVPASLAPGQNFQVVRAGVTPADSFTNEVTVSGMATGAVVEDTDDVSVLVDDPALELTVTPLERSAASGEYADYEVTVTNTGDVPLDIVEVEAIGAFTCYDQIDEPTLEAGESSSATFKLAFTGAVGAEFGATFSATGEYAQGETYGDQVSDQQAASATIVETRLSGKDRIRTSIEAARRLYPDGLDVNPLGDKAVIIATGYDFPDALSASALAGAAEAPVLLVKPSSTHADILALIQELGATKAYIVGGESAVSAYVESQLRTAIPGAATDEVVRLAGSNRYNTAELVAYEVKALVQADGRSVDTVFLATGGDFPDALAASSLAAAMDAPVLLTKTGSIPSGTDRALKDLRPDTVYVCGGEAVVSESVRLSIDGNPLYGSPDAVRRAGTNRYATAEDLVNLGFELGLDGATGADGVFLATGEDYPDALAGGALAGGADGVWRPLMLTKPTYLRTNAERVIVSTEHASFVTLIGGEAALSADVLDQAMALLN